MMASLRFSFEKKQQQQQKLFFSFCVFSCHALISPETIIVCSVKMAQLYDKEISILFHVK